MKILKPKVNKMKIIKNNWKTKKDLNWILIT